VTYFAKITTTKKLSKIPQEENNFYPHFSCKKIHPKTKLVLAPGH